jgi:hypothetical protein
MRRYGTFKARRSTTPRYGACRWRTRCPSRACRR